MIKIILNILKYSAFSYIIFKIVYRILELEEVVLAMQNLIISHDKAVHILLDSEIENLKNATKTTQNHL